MLDREQQAAKRAEADNINNAGDDSVSSPSRGGGGGGGRRGKKKDGRRRDQAAKSGAAAAAAADVDVSMERKVESMVTQQFLFLMSNVVSKRWSSRTTRDKIRAIQVRPVGVFVIVALSTKTFRYLLICLLPSALVQQTRNLPWSRAD